MSVLLRDIRVTSLRLFEVQLTSGKGFVCVFVHTDPIQTWTPPSSSPPTGGIIYLRSIYLSVLLFVGASLHHLEAADEKPATVLQQGDAPGPSCNTRDLVPADFFFLPDTWTELQSALDIIYQILPDEFQLPGLFYFNYYHHLC